MGVSPTSGPTRSQHPPARGPFPDSTLRFGKDLHAALSRLLAQPDSVISAEAQGRSGELRPLRRAQVRAARAAGAGEGKGLFMGR